MLGLAPKSTFEVVYNHFVEIKVNSCEVVAIPVAKLSNICEQFIGSNSTIAYATNFIEPRTQELRAIFAITPTYVRDTQKVDLTSLCQTIMHVKDIVWIVVEDSEKKTALVSNLLKRCQVPSVHLNVLTTKGAKSRGVGQRNAGLKWIRDYCSRNHCNGSVYFMDDDNKYDLRLFDEVG